VEECGVSPIIVDSSAQTLFLKRVQQATIVRPESPPEARIYLCPSLCNSTVVNHFLHELECQLRFVTHIHYLLEDKIDANFCANRLAALVWLVANDKFEEGGKGAVGIVHSLFEEGHSTA
jgi:hypothetical protein